jgi:hypothetical protein
MFQAVLVHMNVINAIIIGHECYNQWFSKKVVTVSVMCQQYVDNASQSHD